MLSLDTSVLESVQEALRTPPPAIVQEFESPIPEKAERFFAWQGQLITDFEARRRAHIERITLAMSALIKRAQEPDSEISGDVLDEVIAEGERALEISATAVSTHETLSKLIIEMYKTSPYRTRVRRAADRIVQATAVQHNAIVREQERLIAAVSELDPEAKEVVGRASDRAGVRAMMAELRAS